MLRQIARYVALASLYVFGIWPLIVFPYWPIPSVWSGLAWLFRKLQPSASGVLINMVVAFPALSSLGISQLANTTVPLRRRIVRAIVMVLAGYPLGYRQDGILISAIDIIARMHGAAFWLALTATLVIATAKALVLITLTLPIVSSMTPAPRLRNAATRWLQRV